MHHLGQSSKWQSWGLDLGLMTPRSHHVHGEVGSGPGGPQDAGSHSQTALLLLSNHLEIPEVDDPQC